MSAPTITRTQLVEAAERLLGVYEAPEELRAEVLDVARTADRVTKAWWVPGEECGCLIGTVLQRRGTPLYGGAVLSEVEGYIGGAFLDELDEALYECGLPRTGFEEPVAVVD